MLKLDWNVLFNIINILILFFLLKRFLFKPVNDIIEKRQAETDASLAAAKEAEASAARSKTEYEESIKNADQEKAAIVSKAREEAAAEYSRIIEEANQKAGSIVEKATADAEKEKTKILQQAQSEVRGLVIDAVARVAGAKAGAENDSALYDEFLRQSEDN